jgi:hypothetical protein
MNPQSNDGRRDPFDQAGRSSDASAAAPVERSGQSGIPGGNENASPDAGLPDAAAETFRVVTEAVASQARSLATNVAEELGASAEAGVTRGADAMQGFARAIESAAASLEPQSPQIARRVRGVADRVDEFSTSIRGRSLRELLDAAQDLARKQPTAFIAGAVVAGFALGRFVTSSAAQRPPESQPLDRTGMCK